ncbi:DegT/DnrJ/EryC1/StrS family aminotransferase [Pseudomonas sp. CAN2814]|uniref:DegT/DnrJ/EryC1/StrS family aminotransferase n=1 Tax=Pseudomonas sp. CAN1 TaxID=3046726 RepID=UPI00264758AB|nr:DegT/DnrJ/EryC1/StrS family aminotransferase [Pseudomonas sp. CAN1]MDN6856452.1 DegT/DnrJ/EryC1/StrS family aminotransferase [Pseudomonas sp. CAN1]
MIPVTRTFLPTFEEYMEQAKGIWESGQLTNNGAQVRSLTSAVSQYLGVSHLELMSNGTLALQLAIRALDLRGEIITTPFSYVATTNAILWEGCEPVFVDIDPQTLCIDPRLIEAAITDKTCGILATHVYGYPCAIETIESIAKKHGLKVIYDAAHAFGGKLNGSSLASFGDCSTLSFHATKLFHSAEGGAVVAADPEVARKLFLLSRFGHIGEDNYLCLGINAKMSELHAAMGMVMLPKVDQIIAARRQCSFWYDEHLQGCHLARPHAPEGLEYNYAYYPVVFDDARSMKLALAKLIEHDIRPRRYFHPALNTLPFLEQPGRYSCPVAESMAERVLSLPMFVGLTEESIKQISGILRSCN